MDSPARRFEHGAHEGDGRALAVGAGDMDHRRQMELGRAQRASSRATRPSERSIFFGCSARRRVRIR